MTREKSDKSLLEKIGLGAITAALAVPVFGIVGVLLFPLTLWRAFVFRYLWLWFAVPTFGLMPLTYGQAIGITYIVGFLHTDPNIKKEYLNGAASMIARSVVHPGIALVFGYVIHRLFM